MGVPDLSGIPKIYREQIDNVLNTLGKNVKIVYQPTVTSVNTSFNDPIRNRDTRKPSYKTTNSAPAPAVTENSDTIKALINWNPKDFEDYGISVEAGDTIVRLKTYITDLHKLNRADYIIPNVDVEPAHQQKFTMIRQPTPRGLGLDRYVYTYWKSSYGG